MFMYQTGSRRNFVEVFKKLCVYFIERTAVSLKQIYKEVKVKCVPFPLNSLGF